MKKSVLLGILFVVAVVGFAVYSTFGADRYRCEVCMSFQGRTECRTASARTKQQAQRAASENACALIASGMTESMQCEQSTPTSVRWLTVN